MLTWASLSMSPMGVFACGVEDREPASAGDTVECLVRRNEGILLPLSSSKSGTLKGVCSWLLKDVLSIHMLRSEELLDPANHGVC